MIKAMLTYNDHKLTWLGHASFRIETGEGRVVYFDPYQLKQDQPKADLITVSHEHFDHCQPESIKKIVKPDTQIVCSTACMAVLEKTLPRSLLHPLKAGEDAVLQEIQIKTIHAYNIDKFRSANELYHPREAGGLGIILEFDEARLYHAGDTDNIPDMEMLTETIDIALLPVSGTYVMTPEEASQAAQTIRPKIAVPMHYGKIIGSGDDAKKFFSLLKNEPQIRVEILETET